jgi:hypothetical protein
VLHKLYIDSVYKLYLPMGELIPKKTMLPALNLLCIQSKVSEKRIIWNFDS